MCIRDSPYDHQRVPYNASHAAVTLDVGARCTDDTDCPQSYCMNDPSKSSPFTCHTPDLTITPYFSPTDSSSSLVPFIQSAKLSIDIAIPGFSSWSGCTPYSNATSCVQACTPQKQRDEEFPVFPALLNAAHAGVKVRLLTNNYETGDCAGVISPLPFLALNGVEIAYYTSTTFLHAKYMAVDGVKLSVSSINFSRTSFTRNREAGALIDGAGAAPLIAMATSVFEADWAQADPLKPQPSGWTAADLTVIQNTSALPVVLPKVSPTQSSYYNPATPSPIMLSAGSVVSLAVSPDFASENLMQSISHANKSLDVMIYQITGDFIADELIALAKRGVVVRLLVSSSIYGHADCELANSAYSKIVNASSSVSIYKTTRHYTYSHQKFWIVDGAEVGWSTGNWGPSDFPSSSAAPTSVVYPVFGQPGWQKLNRDFTVYVKNANVAAAFQAVFEGDLDSGRTFPSPVYPWTSKYAVSCGSG
eukprot:TRINITY_DN4601_c0_g1_i4.p1 TRINITY_DN4601_c0_g1~~TRINITY_DN4601_c0_g1_i4.p1  ORF type:complete len:476 (+),score=69.83 TRINITY_DN4601_c0_g1_i4:149-1576(+)